jgi:carbon storage regulator
VLVIRRHPGETILIGEEIELEVIECGHNRVKLGIRAPQRVAVLRGEVKLTREQNLAAARSIDVGALSAVLGDPARPVTTGSAIPLLGGGPS